ncbi:AMP-binding protein [Nocardioides dubius]|uniref:AMP-binding protein n=1 Tax=Nocardioides dubius TaxID=317019 RepID=UPI0031D409E1
MTLAKVASAVVRWGTGPAGGFTSLAARHPDRIGIIDDLGELTFRQVHERSNALARELSRLGVREGDGVAIMCRNHRGFVDASLATAKLGADALYLNTAFAAPQLCEVIEREQPKLVIYDEEFTELLAAAPITQRVVAWTDTDGATGGDAAADGPGGERITLEQLIRSGDVADLKPAKRHGRVVILTSGTTGTPKGAPRSEAGIDAAVALLSRLPLQYGWRSHIAAPLFHTWGYGNLALGMLLGTTAVLTRRFDPEQALEITERHRCDSMVVIPVMLQRILRLPEETLDRFRLDTVKLVAASGSAMPGDLALAWMDRFGDRLYNIYGSTEVAYASVANPGDLRVAPSSAGRPPWATVVKILDESGRPVPAGESGRIFVGNGMLFEGYTGGGNKELLDGLMSTGDVGRFDVEGRLYVEGRDDEMIVSGGENVFPKEVEDCLARHESVVEVAAIGVSDDEFGKRLRAFVVLAEPVTEDDLKGWVKANLARYKVPRDIVFIDELPRNATGKVIKRELFDWAV